MNCVTEFVSYLAFLFTVSFALMCFAVTIVLTVRKVGRWMRDRFLWMRWFSL